VLHPRADHADAQPRTTKLSVTHMPGPHFCPAEWLNYRLSGRRVNTVGGCRSRLAALPYTIIESDGANITASQLQQLEAVAAQCWERAPRGNLT